MATDPEKSDRPDEPQDDDLGGRRPPLVVMEEETGQEAPAAADGDDQEREGEKKPLNLEVSVAEKSACERHVTVTISREDVDRYLSEAFDELAPEAQVPGFRPGRAPRKLVESRFKKDIAEKVKGTLLMDSLEQVNDAEDFSPISEPDFDIEAIKVPDEGPMTYEFDIEVRPTFDLPQWKGLTIERPVREFSEDDVTAHVKRVMERFIDHEETDGPVEADDYVTLDMAFKHDGRQISSAKSERVQVKPKLSFPDGGLDGFDKLMIGTNIGDVRTAKISISEDADDESLAGQEVEADFTVRRIERIKGGATIARALDSVGGFEDESDLRDAVRGEMERQLEYHQQQEVRRQITRRLTESADFDLPPDLLRRQSKRELERAIMELQASGFSQADIQAYANELRRNSRVNTERALKEHFILERIAEEEEIDVEPKDYDDEITLIARQQKESPRRVRAKLEKHGQMDALRNQILERKVIERVESEATFKDVPYRPKPTDTTASEFAIAGGSDADIPEAKYGPEPASKLPEPAERP